MQHTLFVGQYLRVSLTIPLTFCLQSDQIVSKRNNRTLCVTVYEIVTALVLTVSLGIGIFKQSNYQHIVFSCSTLILVLIFGYALK